MGVAVASAAEDDTATSSPSGGALAFTVKLSAVSAKTATVGYAAADCTATGTSACPAHPGSVSEDYENASGTLTFAPGQITKTVAVNLCADDQQEPAEMLTVALAGPANATLATASAAGTITDNDTPPVLIPR